MIREHDIACDCLDCQYDRQADEDQLSVAVGLIVGFSFSCALYFLLTGMLY
jgi:hypothetical protein